ncbi:MAG TPA: hypothetical protein VKB89_22920 [Xanthobacteraceae bacterium]|nr:hypothetical protein [Xanthobacteraceae bacterium]
MKRAFCSSEAAAAAKSAATKASPAAEPASAKASTTTTTTTHARIGFDHEQRNDEEESRRDAKAGLERRVDW